MGVAGKISRLSDGTVLRMTDGKVLRETGSCDGCTCPCDALSSFCGGSAPSKLTLTLSGLANPVNCIQLDEYRANVYDVNGTFDLPYVSTTTLPTTYHFKYQAINNSAFDLFDPAFFACTHPATTTPAPGSLAITNKYVVIEATMTQTVSEVAVVFDYWLAIETSLGVNKIGYSTSCSSGDTGGQSLLSMQFGCAKATGASRLISVTSGCPTPAYDGASVSWSLTC